MIKEEKKEDVLNEYSPSWRRDYAYTYVFKIPYVMQSTILLIIVGVLLVLISLFGFTSLRLITLAVAVICIGVSMIETRGIP